MDSEEREQLSSCLRQKTKTKTKFFEYLHVCQVVKR
jgi:hypothetical protein